MEIPQPQNKRMIYFLSGQNASEITQQLHGWNMVVDCYNDILGLLAAACHTSTKPQQISLLFDMRGRKENAGELIQLVRQSKKTKHMRCVWLVSENNLDTHTVQAKTSYDHVLNVTQGIDYALLFHALHVGPGHTAEPKVTSLLDHYLRSKTQVPRLEILLAEGSPVHSALSQGLLEKAGHKVYPVGQGDQTLDVLCAHDFDFIIINHKMPCMDGIEVCRLHRLSDIGPLRTPIVMTASEVNKVVYERCQQAGADAVLSLPVNANQLFTALNAIYAEYRENAKLSEPSYHVFQEGQKNRFTKTLDKDMLGELEKLGQGTTFVETIIKAFVSESLSLLGEGKKSAKIHDWSTFRDIMHDLKGAAGSVGLGSLYYQCLALAHMPTEQLFQTAEQELLRLAQNLEKTHQKLRGYIARRQSGLGPSNLT